MNNERITGCDSSEGQFDITPVVVPTHIDGHAFPTAFMREYVLIKRIALLEKAIKTAVNTMDRIPTCLMEVEIV